MLKHSQEILFLVHQTTGRASVLNQIKSLSLTPNPGQAVHASKNKRPSPALTASLEDPSPSPYKTATPQIRERHQL
ncbi:hypothetical protein TNCV_3778151 [Trichonephila clavipes]|nr:hypothetical protein TNCV_3778151 [Trichonephila clavipes]